MYRFGDSVGGEEPRMGQFLRSQRQHSQHPVVRLVFLFCALNFLDDTLGELVILQGTKPKRSTKLNNSFSFLSRLKRNYTYVHSPSAFLTSRPVTSRGSCNSLKCGHLLALGGFFRDDLAERLVDGCLTVLASENHTSLAGQNSG